MYVVVQGALSQMSHMGVVRLEGSGWRGPCHGHSGDGGRSAEAGVICMQVVVRAVISTVIGRRSIMFVGERS